MSAGAVRFDDARAFFDAVRAPLALREVENSLLLGSAKRLADENGKAFLLVLRSPAGVEAAAFRRAPFDLVISAAEQPAVEQLADAVVDAGEDIPGVMGLDAQARWFAERWAARTGRTWQTRHGLPLYTLTSVVPPPEPAPGALRLATPEDQDWLTDWTLAFTIEAGLPEFERDHALIARMVRGRIGRGQQLVWEADGRAVTIVAWASAGLQGARVGPVMTAPEARGRGYGSAAVAALSQKLLDDGRSWCSLFANIENPLSNRIYQRLGYREACRFLAARFS